MTTASPVVAHVIEAMHRGGAESMVIEHVRHATDPSRVVVCALNRGGPALEQARALGAATHVLDKPRIGAFAAVTALARWLRERHVGVVHAHNPTGGLHAAAARALAPRLRLVRTEHSLHYAGRHSSLYPALERCANALTDRVICVCEAVRASHATRAGRFGARLVTIANGVSDAVPARPREAVRAELGATAADVVLLTVGSLTPQKAQHLLLEAVAAAAVARLRVWVAGEGPRRAELEALARTLGVAGSVSWLGDRSDTTELIAACDAFVLTSVREGLPITLLEAMRGGRPCVATDVGGCGEAVTPEVGIVTPSGDREALAAAIARLAADAGARARLGAAARARWQERFHAARMVAASEALYAEVVAEGRRHGAAARA